jgi:hypothetical protein
MAEPVPRKPPKAHGLNWRPVVDEYRQKTDRMDAVDAEDTDHMAADPQGAPDEHEDAMVSPVNLRKFQEQLDRNCLDEIALLVLALTYADMIELANAIWKAQPEGSAITEDNLPALLHRWSKSRSAAGKSRPRDSTDDSAA